MPAPAEVNEEVPRSMGTWPVRVIDGIAPAAGGKASDVALSIFASVSNAKQARSRRVREAIAIANTRFTGSSLQDRNGTHAVCYGHRPERWTATSGMSRHGLYTLRHVRIEKSPGSSPVGEREDANAFRIRGERTRTKLGIATSGPSLPPAMRIRPMCRRFRSRPMQRCSCARRLSDLVFPAFSISR